jgi:hypothetical protein
VRVSQYDPPHATPIQKRPAPRGASPLATARAAELLALLLSRGGKAYLDEHFYDLARDRGLDAHHVDSRLQRFRRFLRNLQAIEHLFGVGVIDARFAGGRGVVEVLSGRRFVESQVVEEGGRRGR